MKIKVIGLLDKNIAELYLYYYDKNDNVVGTLVVNNQGDLICNITNNIYRDKILLDINKILGFDENIDDDYYITDNKEVWNNTKKFIKEKNLIIIYKEDLDLEYEELNKNFK